MTIIHHADDATLISFAAGTLPEALCAVVATHIAMCPRCRAELSHMERLGAVMLEGLAPAVTGPAPAVRAINPAMTSKRAAIARAPVERQASVPDPLSRLVGKNLSDIRWKRLGIGMWHAPLPLSKGAKGDLRLFKVAPGLAMPEHGHGGSELSLILEGSYTDEFGRFGVGDLADLDTEAEHQPVADPATGCICLIAAEEKARFKGLLARLVQPFVGI